MASRLPNPRRAKIHRSYTVEEVARLYAVHRNTVRMWIKSGLPVCDDRRPTLILGKDLAAFLAERRARNKRPCQPGEIYCVRCRAPQRPALDMVDYQPMSAAGGNLIGICLGCGSTMYRRVSAAKLTAVMGDLEIKVTAAAEHIVDSGNCSVTSDFKPEA
jgi:excisionase family DNA binding protein